MAHETRALVLSGLLKRRQSSIPRGVLTWTSFHKLVLEKRLVARNLNKEDFYARSRVILTKYGPHSLRKHTSTARRVLYDTLGVWWYYYTLLCREDSLVRVRQCGDKGQGVFTRRSATLDELKRVLVGPLASLPEEDFDLLRSHDYPSLYGACYILFGPLSLVNHECGCNVRLGSPYHGSSGGELEGFPRIALKAAGKKRKRVYQPGEEVVVRYTQKGMVSELGKFVCPFLFILCHATGKTRKVSVSPTWKRP